jgi:hypothetical protein
MKSRYPLLRLELYPTHERAREAFKEARTVFRDNFTFKISDLVMEDRHLQVRFLVPDVGLLKGLLADKIVVHFPLSVSDDLYKELFSHIKPNTTVRDPIVFMKS